MFAVVWHFWIAPLLVAGAILAVVGTIVGYIVKVTSMQYPKGKQKQQ